MKKTIALALTIMALLTLFAMPALAGGDHTNYAFGYRGYTDGTTLNHNAGQFHKKGGSETFIEVRHSITNAPAGISHTTYMYAKINGGNYVGAKWQAPDMNYYACSSTSLVANKDVTPGGRANTDWRQYGCYESMMIEGQNRVH